MNNNFNQIQKPTGFGSGFTEPPQLQIGSPFNNNCDAYLNTFKYNEQQQYNYKSPYYNNLKNNNNLVNLLLNNIDILDELENNISIEDLWVDLLYSSIDKKLLNKLPRKFETEDFYIKLINKMLGETNKNILQNNINSFKSIVGRRKETNEKEQYKSKECGHDNKNNVILDFSEIYDMDLRNKKYDDISSQSIINNILNMGAEKLNIISNLNAITKYDYKLTLFINIYKSDNFKSENTITTTGEADINLSNIPSSTINSILNDVIKIIRNEVIKYIFIDKYKFNINIGLQIENNN